MSNDEEIDNLIREIQKVKITTANNIRRLEEKVLEIKSSRSRRPRRSVDRAQEDAVTTGTVIINVPRDTQFIIHQDRYGREIHIGSKVKFLSKGKFDSTEGYAILSDSTWVKSRDNKGRLIKRTPKNLQVISSD